MTALVAAAASKNGVLAKARVPGAAWFAAASYSLYLSHKIVYRELHAQFAPWIDGHGIWTALIYIVAILAVGAALHYAVERPFLKLREPVRRRWSQRRFQRCRLGGVKLTVRCNKLNSSSSRRSRAAVYSGLKVK